MVHGKTLNTTLISGIGQNGLTLVGRDDANAARIVFDQGFIKIPNETLFTGGEGVEITGDLRISGDIRKIGEGNVNFTSEINTIDINSRVFTNGVLIGNAGVGIDGSAKDSDVFLQLDPADASTNTIQRFKCNVGQESLLEFSNLYTNTSFDTYSTNSPQYTTNYRFRHNYNDKSFILESGDSGFRVPFLKCVTQGSSVDTHNLYIGDADTTGKLVNVTINGDLTVKHFIAEKITKRVTVSETSIDISNGQSFFIKDNVSNIKFDYSGTGDRIYFNSTGSSKISVDANNNLLLDNGANGNIALKVGESNTMTVSDNKVFIGQIYPIANNGNLLNIYDTNTYAEISNNNVELLYKGDVSSNITGTMTLRGVSAGHQYSAPGAMMTFVHKPKESIVERSVGAIAGCDINSNHSGGLAFYNSDPSGLVIRSVIDNSGMRVYGDMNIHNDINVLNGNVVVKNNITSSDGLLDCCGNITSHHGDLILEGSSSDAPKLLIRDFNGLAATPFETIYGISSYYNRNILHFFGKTAIGSHDDFNGDSIFSHIDKTYVDGTNVDVSGYALKANNLGHTFINSTDISSSGVPGIHFNINNTQKMLLNPSGHLKLDNGVSGSASVSNRGSMIFFNNTHSDPGPNKIVLHNDGFGFGFDNYDDLNNTGTLKYLSLDKHEFYYNSNMSANGNLVFTLDVSNALFENNLRVKNELDIDGNVTLGTTRENVTINGTVTFDTSHNQVGPNKINFNNDSNGLGIDNNDNKYCSNGNHVFYTGSASGSNGLIALTISGENTDISNNLTIGSNILFDKGSSIISGDSSLLTISGENTTINSNLYVDGSFNLGNVLEYKYDNSEKSVLCSGMLDITNSNDAPGLKVTQTNGTGSGVIARFIDGDDTTKYIEFGNNGSNAILGHLGVNKTSSNNVELDVSGHIHCDQITIKNSPELFSTKYGSALGWGLNSSQDSYYINYYDSTGTKGKTIFGNTTANNTANINIQSILDSYGNYELTSGLKFVNYDSTFTYDISMIGSNNTVDIDGYHTYLNIPNNVGEVSHLQLSSGLENNQSIIISSGGGENSTDPIHFIQSLQNKSTVSDTNRGQLMHINPMGGNVCVGKLDAYAQPLSVLSVRKNISLTTSSDLQTQFQIGNSTTSSGDTYCGMSYHGLGGNTNNLHKIVNAATYWKGDGTSNYSTKGYLGIAVNSTAATNDFHGLSDANLTTNTHLSVHDDGRVGIGTVDPSSTHKMEVNGKIKCEDIDISGGIAVTPADKNASTPVLHTDLLKIITDLRDEIDTLRTRINNYGIP